MCADNLNLNDISLIKTSSLPDNQQRLSDVSVDGNYFILFYSYLISNLI